MTLSSDTIRHFQAELAALDAKDHSPETPM